MEVYLLDVGQGTSNVILLGAQEAIVIDAGAKLDFTLLRLLRRFSVGRLRRLIISHNDADHLGGALSLLDEFEGAIDEVWFVDDVKLMRSRFWDRLNEQHSRGTLDRSNWHRLERDADPRVVYSDPKSGARLEAFAPTFAANLIAQIDEEPNATSAVLSFRYGPHSIVFGGDASLDEWRSIVKLLGQPLTCDLFVVPHHGGDIGIKSPQDLQWFYTSGVRSKTAVISVGTVNTHGHPRRDVIQQICSSGSKVMCTQITEHCCSKLESLRPGVLTPHVGSRSSTTPEFTSRGNSRNVACAGTVVVDIDASGIDVHQRAEHDLRIDKLVHQKNLKPMCRP